MRTELQREADMADLDLHAAISRLEALADSGRIPNAAALLRTIALDLRGVRPRLRALMHPRDRDATQ